MDKIREFICSRFLTNILLILLFVAVVFGILEIIQVKLGVARVYFNLEQAFQLRNY